MFPEACSFFHCVVVCHFGSLLCGLFVICDLRFAILRFAIRSLRVRFAMSRFAFAVCVQGN